jgi:predicted metalloprotease with PDZ domain
MREESNGKRGILNLMQGLSNEYGSEKPFKDEELFAKITELTYPEVGAFLEKHVSGTTPIPYDVYFAKVGVVKAPVEVPGNPFLKGMTEPNISISRETREIFILPNVELNAFMTALGVKNNDVILEVNGTKYNYDNVNDMVISSFGWKEGDMITFKVRRDGKILDLKGKVVLPREMKDSYAAASNDKKALREAWLKGK